MTEYLLSVWMREGTPMPSEDEMKTMYARVDEFNDELKRSGAWVFAGGLDAASMATVVDATKPGEPVTTDGPFAESKEQLGGFWVLQAENLDAALALARAGSAACGAPVEVRPFSAAV